MNCDAAIIGGGISGMTAAFELSRSGMSVELLEAEKELGGLISCIERPGYRIERLYHHLFEHDTDALDLIRQLGLENRLIWRETRAGFYYEGNWFDVSSPLNLLRFRPLPLAERLKLGWKLWQAKREKHPERLDDVSVSEWLGLKSESKMMEVFDRLVCGKFGIGPNETSAAFLSGRFRGRTRERSLLSSKERFGYIDGSLQRLIYRLAEEIEVFRGKIHTDSRVLKISRDDSFFKIKTTNGRALETKYLVSTIPPRAFGEIADFLSEPEKVSFAGIDFAGVICLLCGLDRSISPYYWVTVDDPSLPFLALIEQTRFHRPRGCEDEHLVYIARYEDSGLLDRVKDGDIEQEMLNGLERISSNGRPRVLWRHTSVFKNATPIYRVGFGAALRKLPQVEGLWMTGATFTYPDSRNINSMIRAARRVSKEIIARSKDTADS